MSSSVRSIPLTKGFVTTVDADDYEVLALHQWHFHSGYAGRWIRRRLLLMHRVILNAQAGEQVDHIDGDPLNNVRSNLRLCSHAQNIWHQSKQANNTSGYKGVYRRHTRLAGWEARIMVKGKRLNLGVYRTPQEAALAYNAAAVEYCGAFAFLNEVLEP